MNTRKFFLAAALLVSGTSSLFAQTADEVVDKYLAAIGGKDAWHNLNSLRVEGTANASGTEIPIVMTTVQKKAMRMDMTIMGMSNYTILTPTNGWAYFPVRGQKEPEAMTADQVTASQDQLDIQGILLDYKAKGETCELIGKEDVDGTECYKLKLADPKKGVTNYCYIDPTNYYLIRVTTKMKVDGQDQEQTMNFSNFQKTGAGIVYPMSISGGMGDVNFKNIAINPKIDESIFTVAAAKPAK